jgi:hypothetical protein
MTTTATTDTQRKFAALYREKLELQDRLNQVTKELGEMQEPMLDFFGDAGMQSVSVDGITLYIHEQIWANTAEGSTKELACEALVANGFGEFVSPGFNTSTLSAKAREMERNGESFPEAVLAHIKVAPKVEIRARRS